ncbi:DUF4476 domain-containing protein [Aureispira anguillae]|uniref:DUF4476 domain-containing protein n=1 Tax=Aureispira anguillae TaxID=2864201 RepID=A0A916DSU6_9BACT|nr:DUF4476 domain-containing protein [Aureispira anguillae]BDS12126.1 DUF4476 domain-containing protein [Aureispira anguillae]
MTHFIAYLIIALLLSSCEGNVSGEIGGKYETNKSYTYTEKVNGKTVKEIQSNTHSGGAFESDFNLVIGNGDTTITAEEIPNLNPKISCTQTLNDQDVERLKTAISRAFLDKNRVLIAKIAINDWCLTSNQVRDLLALFTMDKYRLDFAKFAYGHVNDRTNYNRVKDAFSFQESKGLLDNYINTL